jgi:hypothetical protein
MSIEPIKTEVRGLLAQVNYDIKHAEEALRGGAPQQRVRAAGRLVFLTRRKEELEVRQRELDQSPDGLGSTLIQWFREDWMLVLQRLEDWAEGRS